MSTHHRKIFTALLFISVLSFAFYFSFSSYSSAQETGGLLCLPDSLGRNCHWEIVGGQCTQVQGGGPDTCNPPPSKFCRLVQNGITRDGRCATVSECQDSRFERVPDDQCGGASQCCVPKDARVSPEPEGGLGNGDSDLPGIDLTIDDVANIIYGFACWLWSISIVLIVIFVIISGLRFMYAGANPTKFADAQKNFKYVILGAIVVMGTFVIIATIAYNIGVDISFVPFSCATSEEDVGDEEPTRYGCSNQGCVENPRGGYTNPYCDNACEKPVGQTCSARCDQIAEEICSAVYPEGGEGYWQCFREEQTACCDARSTPTPTPPNLGYCGDRICNGDESAFTCPQDCQP